MKPAVRARHLSKCYRLGASPRGGTNLTDHIRGGVRRGWQKVRALADPSAVPEENAFWALDDVSFEVMPGEVVGVIGRNGAGKSTLLKLLSRITVPTQGRIEIRGRMGSLLEVGTGFHPELTGRENVFLSGSILGMSRAEIRSKFDKIVAFSEVEQFLDTPVKRYSSGMYVRLAFAVAAHLDPEILIVDEVLAVGDATFQRRCIDRMGQLATEGRTILFVSHNMHLIPKLCSRAVLLHKGKVQQVGDAAAVTQAFLDQQLADARTGDLSDKPRTGDGKGRFVSAAILDAKGEPTTTFTSGDDLTVRFAVDVKEPIPNAELAVVVQTLHGLRVLTSWSREAGFPIDLVPGRHQFECKFASVPFRPGHTLVLNLWLAGVGRHDFVENAVLADVVGDARTAHLSPDSMQSLFVCPQHWRAVPA